MMNAALHFLSVEVRGLQKVVYVLAACALLSSILALVRDRLLAAAFGASTTLDLYYAAFRIPDLIFVGIGALVSVYILIPELVRRSDDEQRKYIDTIIVGFLILSVVSAAVAALFAPFFLARLFPQFTLEGHLPQLVTLTRIILLQPLLLGFSNILAAITQSRQRYILYAVSPLLYNLGIIFGVVVLYPLWGASGLVWGVVAGAGLHASVQVPAVIRDGFLRRLPQLWDWGALLRTSSVSVPRALALSMNQITFLGLAALAGSLTSGSIAIFMFSYNLQAVPLSIIGASYSVAAFPTLALALSKGQREEFIAHIAQAARYVFFWSLPVIALIIVLRAHIVRVILGSGAFDWTDTRLTAAALALLALSLAAQSVTLLIVRGYYAAGRTFVPFIVSLGMMVGTLGLATFFVSVVHNETLLRAMQILLRVEDLQGTAVLTLVFAFSLLSIIGAVVLIFHFEYRFQGFLSRIIRALGESIVAAFAAGVGAYIILIVVGPLTFASTTLSILSRGILAGAFGTLMAGIAYYLAGSREFNETLEAVRGHIPFVKLPHGVVPITSSAEETNPMITQ